MIKNRLQQTWGFSLIKEGKRRGIERWFSFSVFLLMKRKGEEGKIRGGNLGGSRIVGLLLGRWVEAQPVSGLFIKWVRDPHPNQAIFNEDFCREELPGLENNVK